MTRVPLPERSPSRRALNGRAFSPEGGTAAGSAGATTPAGPVVISAEDHEDHEDHVERHGVQIPWTSCQRVLGLSRATVQALAFETIRQRNELAPEAIVDAIMRNDGVSFPVGAHEARVIQVGRRLALWVKGTSTAGNGRGSSA